MREVTSELLFLGARGDHAHGLTEQRIEREVLEVEADAAGLDLRHIEDVVDDLEQILPAAADVAAIFVIFLGTERPEHIGFHDLGESDDRVERRAQLMAHIGEEFRFRLIGFFGAGLFGGIFLGQFRRALLRGAQVRHGRHQPLLAVDQFLLVHLERGDVGADRHVAAILGAPLADVQPAAVLELRLERAGAGNSGPGGDDLVAHYRFLAGGDDRLVGCADGDGLVGQIVQLLEVGIAQHQPIIGVPQHECFRNGLDGVAQAQVGGDGFLHQVLLLGDVDGDADEMRPRFARLAYQFAARAQPDPMAVGVAHAEGVVDKGQFGVDEFGREFVKLHVVRMHQSADVAEGEQVVLALQSEDFEHRLRPEDAAAGEVPIPQAAAATVERGIDAAADGFVDDVRLARARGLPVERKAEDQHNKAGGSGQRDGERGERAPGGKRGAARLHDGDLAERRLEHAHGRQRARVVGQGDFHDAGAGAERGERLRRTEEVDQAAADGVVGGGRGGRHHALRIGQDEAPPGAGRPARQRARENFLRPFDGIGGRHAADRSTARSATASSSITMSLSVCRRWSSACTKAPTHMVARKAMISTGTARRSNGSAVSSRRYAGLAIDCARPLMESRTRRRTRHTGARHRRPPFGISPNALSEGCAASLSESVAIGIDGRRFVESPATNI